MGKCKYCLLIVLSWHVCFAGIFSLDFYKKQAAQFFVNDYEEKQHLLNVLQEELAQFQKKETDIQHKVGQELLTLNKHHKALTEQSYTPSEKERIKKKKQLIDDSKKLLEETQRFSKQMVLAIKKNIDVLKSYIEDSSFTPIRIAEKSAYTFDELQTIAKQLYRAEQELKQFQEAKKCADQVYTQVSSNLEQAEHDLEHKEKSIHNHNEERTESALLLLEIHNAKVIVEHLKVKKLILAKELELAQLQEFITSCKVKLFKNDLTRIERTLWVTDDDVQREYNSVNIHKKEYEAQRDTNQKELAQLTYEREQVQKEFDTTRTTLKQPLQNITQLSEWVFVVPAEPMLYRAMYLNALINKLDRQIALADAKQVLRDVELAQQELKLDIMNIWVTIAHRRFLHDGADRSKRLSALITKKAEFERQKENYASKSTTLTHEMAHTAHILDHIQHEAEKHTKRGGNTQLFETIRKAQVLLEQQQALEHALIKTYQAIVQQVSEMCDDTSLVIQKFSVAHGILQRSAGAITLEGIKSVATDFMFFINYILAIFSLHDNMQFYAQIKQSTSDSTHILSMLLVLVLMLIIYFVGLICLPLVQQVLLQRKQRSGETLFLNFLLTACQFVQQHLLSLVIWLVLFYLVRYDAIFTLIAQVKIIFYLISIVYICYMLRVFKRFYVEDNTIVLQKDFYRRALRIVYYFALLTTITYFLSEAFITVTYGDSFLTRMLWEVYSLITRALVVLLITNKNLVLALIPERGFWAFIREQINRYYVILLAIALVLIVLSDPFIGYGKLVSAILQALLLTIGLVVALKFALELLRHYSSRIFFVTAEEATRERFAHSKTWYVLFVVVSLSLLVACALVIFVRIWGYQISLHTLHHVFNFELTKVKGDIAGSVIPITVKSILLVILFVFGGVLLSSLFNRYVLQRMYLLLHAEAGVQNTISRISSYIFIIIALIWGLQRAGLGAWGLIVVPFLLIAAWAAKGPADDFFAYFIILIERSVKVGDYIRIDSLRGDIAGVVRKITPRSVILRRRNSFTIIVPNSKLMRSYVYNWNYSHNYITFDDIIITVSYDTDPDKVRDILLNILAENNLILKSPAPVVRIENFSINGYEVMVRGFLSTAQVLSQWNIRSDIRFAILKEFKKHNVILASPVQAIKLEINKSGEEQ